MAPYDPKWPVLAQKHADQLRAACSPLRIVYHIGSTAVPGLAAKPIIDLMPLTSSLVALDQERPNLEQLGYLWHGEYGIAGRRYCTLADPNDNRLVHLHIFEETSPAARRHIAFRNYLQAFPEAAAAYEAEKLRARDLHPNDRRAYSDEKSAWIQHLEAEALMWFNQQTSI